MKKLLLGLGAVAAVAAPVAAAVACGSGDLDTGTTEMTVGSTKTSAALKAVTSGSMDQTKILSDLGYDVSTLLTAGNTLDSAEWDSASQKLTIKTKNTTSGKTFTSTIIYTLTGSDAA